MTKTFKKVTAGMALATMVGASVPTFADAHEYNGQREKERQHVTEHHVDKEKHERLEKQPSLQFDKLQEVEVGTKIGIFTVASVEKDKVILTTDEKLSVTGTYKAEQETLFLNRTHQKKWENAGLEKKLHKVVVTNAEEADTFLSQQKKNKPVTVTLSDIQLVITEDGRTAEATVSKSVQ